MKRLLILSLSLMLLGFWMSSSSAVEVTGKKGDAVIKIETDMYTVHWKTAAQMGYVTALIKSAKEELPIIEGDGETRRLYHSANYAGWKDWGNLVDFEIAEEGRGFTRVKFVSDDGDSKEYTCLATFWDGHPLIKHEVTVKAKKAVVSFADGHEPMYEIRGPSRGMKMWPSEGNNGPFARVAFWTRDGFSALYATDPTVIAGDIPGWANGLGNGRMQLDHTPLGKQLANGDVSDPIVYWVAFGAGEEDEANALSETVAAVGTGDLAPQSVDARGKLYTTWAALKNSR